MAVEGRRMKVLKVMKVYLVPCYLFAMLFVCHTLSLILYVYPTGLLLLEAFRGMTVVGFIWYFYVENTNLSLERIDSCFLNQTWGWERN